MIQCPKCKSMLGDEVRFCPNDGTPLSDTAAEAPPTPSDETKSTELELPVVVGNRYRLEAVRGGGGMAKVYRAVDLTLERNVAVKLINPELRNDPEFDARFQREARIVSQLADPHIVVVHDFGLDPDLGPYLVMEYLNGQSLRERIKTDGPLPMKAALQLSGQMLLALIHAHDKGIIHRDIKPDNVFLLNQSGVKLHVRVLDFGIARIMRPDEEVRGGMLTSPGAVLGTPRYMSPEQLASQAVDARTDLYSAALVIHEALTGQVPYPASPSLCSLCPEATESLQKLLTDCLNPQPGKRPPSSLEMYLRLQELGRASGVLLLPPDAIGKLIQARKNATTEGDHSTIAYGDTENTPASGISRRKLIWAGVGLAALAGGGYFAQRYFFPEPTGTPGGPESLLGVRIGDGVASVRSKIPFVESARTNPFEDEDRPDWLAHSLQPSDLGLATDQLDALSMHWNENRSIAALFHRGKLIALIVREPARGQTGRGSTLGSSVSTYYEKYGNEPLPKIYQANPNSGQVGATPIEVRKHPALGISFEISNARISAITLFPKRVKPAPEKPKLK